MSQPLADQAYTTPLTADAKANGKRIPKDKPAKEPKKARKDAAVNGDSQAEQGDKVGSGRRAAQNLAFVEKAVRVSNADKLFIKEEAKCETEKEALLHTEAGMPSIKARRLGDCSVADEDGHLAPIESVVFSQKPLFISGVIYPSQGAVTKETGRRVERFGPLRSFCVDTSGKEASVVVTTDAGSYTVLKPSVAYKKVFSNLAGQSDIFYEVFQALSPQHGGSAFATLEEVVARLARAKATKGFANPREGLLLNGRFVLAQLARVDESTGSKAVKFGETDFAKALSQALADFTYVGAQGQVAANGGIVIRDPAEMKVQAVFEGKGKGRAEPEADAQMEADAELARQLQAKIDAEMRSK